MLDRSLGKIRRLQARAQEFFDIRAIEAQEESQVRFTRKFAHFWLLVCKSFVRNRCPARASALAYTTLLALIPMLAIVVGVSSSMLKKEGGKPIQDLIERLVTNLAPQLDLVTKSEEPGKYSGRQEVIRRINNYIENIHSGTLNVTGIVALIFVAIGMLRTIEATFNDIWGVSRGRRFFSSVIRYWAAITLWPLVLLVAIGLMTGPHLQTTQRWVANFPFLSSILFSFVPFLMISLAFVLFYQLMPNTKVHWRAAIIGGLVGSALWQLNNYFNVIYVSRVITYSKVYGSMGLVLVFLIGLYFSWLILLFGAQVAYAIQNRRAYLQEKRAENVNERGREFVAFRIMTYLGQQFAGGDNPPSASQIAEDLGVPTRLVCQTLDVLTQANLAREVVGNEPGYVPARPLSQITGHDILLALRVSRGNELSTREEPACGVVLGEFEAIERAQREVAEQLTLEALVERSLQNQGKIPGARQLAVGKQ